jgi:hypothetical protein
MARLRAAYVEFRRCPSCGAEYGGRRCPQCKTPASPATERLLKQLLIVDDHEIPLFVRQERWRCPCCDRLYEPPTVGALIAAARAHCACGASRSSAWQPGPAAEAHTVLERARQLARHLKREPRCGRCQRPWPVPCWCPFCRGASSPPTDALPLRATWVYVPTGAVAVPLWAELADQAETGADEESADHDQNSLDSTADAEAAEPDREDRA